MSYKSVKYINIQHFYDLMETVSVPKEMFSKILEDVETLIDDVESALDTKVRKRIFDIESGKEKGKTEEEYYEYLTKRGISLGRV